MLVVNLGLVQLTGYAFFIISASPHTPLLSLTHIYAQSLLGAAYLEGFGVSQDNKKAFEWSQKAAEQGHAEAQLNLAVMYNEGRGVAQDSKKTKEWLQKVTEQGTGF